MFKRKTGDTQNTYFLQMPSTSVHIHCSKHNVFVMIMFVKSSGLRMDTGTGSPHTLIEEIYSVTSQVIQTRSSEGN